MPHNLETFPGTYPIALYPSSTVTGIDPSIVPSMNFARDIFQRFGADQPALVSVSRSGDPSHWTFGQLDAASAEMAGVLWGEGVRRGDVVATLLGNRPEWVITLLACFRIGAVAAPCTQQLRQQDLESRFAEKPPTLLVVDDQTAAVAESAALPSAVLTVPVHGHAARAGFEELALDDPALMIFTSGTSGHPKAAVHGLRYLYGQSLQAEHWLAARAGDLVWCTAAAGWSKSVRNSFVAPWLRGATAFIHDARFDPLERLALIHDHRVSVLCMSPTEYRFVAAKARLRPLPHLRSAVSAGEALGASTFGEWSEQAGIAVRDGYGQTETGAVTGNPVGLSKPGSMGLPLPGVATEIRSGELCVRPETLPTFFLGYDGQRADVEIWRTGDLVEIDEDGFLWFLGRADDVIVSSGYRIDPTEVEHAIETHPDVSEAAVVGQPDALRGEVVRAFVVLNERATPSSVLVTELQAHVRTVTAPYKYPRAVEFVTALPRTASGKLQRSALRSRQT
jgi:acyl-coenzyme A synthetase/AMP-(fatty) acid ligase